MPKLKLLISPEEIASMIAAMATLLDSRYFERELTLCMIMKGSIVLVSDLIRKLKGMNVLEFISAASYGPRGKERGALTVKGVDELKIEGKDLLLIDDIFDSGSTLSEVKRQLLQKNPASLQTLVLLKKKTARTRSDEPDYALFEIEDHFVVGYGLDYKEHYRGLNGIYIIEETP